MWRLCVVRGGQQLLREIYLSRDAFCSEEDAARPWCAGTAVKVSRDAWVNLNQLRALLPEAERSYYLDGSPEENGFFRGVTTRSNEFMDSHSEAHAGIPVFTTDASGTGGGGYFRHAQFAHSYPEELCAPNKSSNFREFDTGLRGTKQLVAARVER